MTAYKVDISVVVKEAPENGILPYRDGLQLTDSVNIGECTFDQMTNVLTVVHDMMRGLASSVVKSEKGEESDPESTAGEIGSFRHLDANTPATVEAGLPSTRKVLLKIFSHSPRTGDVIQTRTAFEGEQVVLPSHEISVTVDKPAPRKVTVRRPNGQLIAVFDQRPGESTQVYISEGQFTSEGCVNITVS